MQLGAALGLAILSAVATARDQVRCCTPATSLARGGHRRLPARAVGRRLLRLAAAVIALLAPNTRQAASAVEEEPVLDLAAFRDTERWGESRLPPPDYLR